MFKVDQKVWCAIYGAGVVKRIRQEGVVDYPVVVVFNRNDDENVVTYTLDGKYHDEGNVTLFPHPIEIVKATIKPSINWSHVSKDFRYLAMDEDGEFYLYSDKPLQGNQQWVSNLTYTPAIHFSSFTPGTCDWEDSLVKRPD